MNEERYIVNIGLGPWQTPLVEAAQAMGYRVIGVDINPDAPGAAGADSFLRMSAHEPGPIRDALTKLDLGGAVIRAVITIGSRGSLTCAGVLARDLDVRGRVVDLEALDTLVDREKFRSFLQRHGLAVPIYRVVTSSEMEIDIPLPLIAKSVLDTSGSEGLTVVRERSDLCDAIRHAQKIPRHGMDGRVIVEQYIEGRDIGVFGFFSDGELYWQAFVDREVEPMPHCLPKHYSAPATLSEIEISVLNDNFCRIAQAIAVADGPFYAEFRLVEDGPACYALEAEPTLPAYATRLLADAYAIDPYRHFVETVVEGQVAPIVAEPGAAACRFVYGQSPGRIGRIERPERLSNGSEIRVLQRVGASVDNASARSICAVAFAVAKNVDVANQRAGKLADQVEVEIEPAVPLSEAPASTPH